MKYKLLILVLALSVMFACNSIHEFPDNAPNDPSLVETEIALTLGVEIEMGVEIQTRSNYEALMTDHDVRYIVDIYQYPTKREASLGNRILRIVHSERELQTRDHSVSAAKSLKFRPENYLVLVWIDFVSRGTVHDLHYDTRDLTAIKQTSANGFHLSKDAFCASATLELAQFKGQKEIRYTLKCPIERPFALYEIIATDLDKYISTFGSLAAYDSFRPTESTTGYELYLPKGFSVLNNVPNALTSNISYKFNTIDNIEKRQVILASDYVFVANNSYFNVDMAIRNVQGATISAINGLKINLWRNRKTIIYGEFLTRGLDGGEIGVDGKFGDEIIVPI